MIGIRIRTRSNFNDLHNKSDLWSLVSIFEKINAWGSTWFSYFVCMIKIRSYFIVISVSKWLFQIIQWKTPPYSNAFVDLSETCAEPSTSKTHDNFSSKRSHPELSWKKKKLYSKTMYGVLMFDVWYDYWSLLSLSHFWLNYSCSAGYRIFMSSLVKIKSYFNVTLASSGITKNEVELNSNTNTSMGNAIFDAFFLKWVLQHLKNTYFCETCCVLCLGTGTGSSWTRSKP